jgi:hypothetical protein
MQLAMFLQVVALPLAVTTKVIAVAAVVYAALVALKKVWPSITGWYSVAINVTLAVVLIISTTPPDQLFTFQTLMQILAAAAAAAGVHGTVRSFRGAGKP